VNTMRCLIAVLIFLSAAAAHASTCPPLPYVFVDGTIADAGGVPSAIARGATAVPFPLQGFGIPPSTLMALGLPRWATPGLTGN